MRAWIICCLIGLALPASAAPVGFGALGDSIGDEYQFRSGPITGTQNYVELLANLRGLNFGAFTTASRGEPRNQGYEYNFANVGDNTVAGVTAPHLFSQGQVQGLAQQVAAGLVTQVFLTIGGNDFRAIAGGADPNTVLANLLTSTVAAVQALQAANPNVKIVIANVVDITKVPGAQFALLQNPALAPQFAALDAAANFYNASLAGLFAPDPNVAVADINAVLDNLFATHTFAGQPIDTLNPGAGPGHLFADLLHPGTIGSGLIANALVNAGNAKFGTDVRPFSDAELLAAAQAGGANTIPLPAALWVGATCVPMILARVRRHRAA